MYGITSLMLCLLLCVFSGPKLYAESLGVFLPSDVLPKELEKALKKDKVFESLDIKAFSQIKDFKLAQESESFDYVILPSAYFRYNTSYIPALQLTRKGERQFQYHVLSLEKEWDEKKMPEGIVSLVEEVERQHAKTFVQQILEGRQFKRIKQVSRLQDLYPMLALGNSNYILISPSTLEEVRRTITAKPVSVLKTIQIPYSQIGYLSKKKELSAKLSDWTKLSKASLGALGYDALEVIEK